MSGVRQSFVFCIEDEYGEGKPSSKEWIAPPPGSYISTTHNRSTQKIFTAGSKTYDVAAFGQLSGSWEWTFTMDYDYIEPFFLAFEDVSSSGNTITFKKSNNARVPSFCIRRKVLNKMTGGGSDEMTTITGCVVKSLRFSKPGGSSQINVSMSGFYSNESMETNSSGSWTTDYQEYNGDLVEFACMFAGAISNNNYVANTESITLGIENGAGQIFTTCTPFAKDYFEGQTSYTFGTTCYSNDPDRYKRRVYSGGNSLADSPKAKGMTALSEINIASYSSEMDGDNSSIASTYSSSPRSACLKLTDVSFKSLTWQKGDGSKLQDQINSTECRLIELSVKGSAVTVENIWRKTDPHHLGAGVAAAAMVAEVPLSPEVSE